MATITGSSGPDFLNGTSSGDSIEGFAGDDTLNGLGGGDILIGGLGSDILDGGAGFDWASYFAATSGVTADLTNPAFNTGEAAGDLYISIENILGSNFDDSLTADDGDSTLDGQDGDDTLIGGDGLNFFFGGEGADSFVGGADDDWVFYNNSIAGLVIDMLNPANSTGEATGDTFASIENVRGSDFDDRIVGNAADNQIEGRDGNDTLVGGAGRDLFIGGNGIDEVSYIGSPIGLTATMVSAAGSSGEAMHDRFFSGIEILRGSLFDDTLLGNRDDNTIFGESGNDKIWGGEDQNELNGGAGNDTLVGAENGNLGGFNAGDTLIGGSGQDSLIGRDGADIYTGGADADIFQFDVDDGNNIITDFENGTDSVKIEGNLSFSDVSIQQNGSDALVSFGATNVTLLNTLVGDLDASDFQFRTPAVTPFETLGAPEGLLWENPLPGIFAEGNFSQISEIVGDINGDGLDDLLVASGRTAYIVFGSPLAFSLPTNLNQLSGVDGFRIDGSQFFINGGGRFPGFTITGIGDFNGDGFNDIAVGAGGTPVANGTVGSVFIVFGTDAGFDPTISLLALDGTDGFRINRDASMPDGRFGTSLNALGDINNDGFDDVAISAPSSGTDPRELRILYGTSDPVAPVETLGAAGELDNFVIERNDGQTAFSQAFALGDINNDGIDDFAVPVSAEEQFLGSGQVEEQVYVYYGNTTKYSGTIDIAGLNGTNGFVMDGSNLGHRFGYTIKSIGDFNGDGIDDFYVGAPISNKGSAYIFYGQNGNFPAVFDPESIDGTNGFRLLEFDLSESAVLGFNAGPAGDQNNDGFDDVTINVGGNHIFAVWFKFQFCARHLDRYVRTRRASHRISRFKQFPYLRTNQ